MYDHWDIDQIMSCSTSDAQEVCLPNSDKQLPNQLNDPVFFGSTPGDELASRGGTGTLGVLEVTRLLEGAGLPCCIIGISSLIYFGANMVERASALLKTRDAYEPCPPGPVQLWSLLHTFPHFKLKGKSLWFLIIPLEDCHLNCNPSNAEPSRTGLPHPTLEVFAQSLLDTNDLVPLADLVDGMDLTEEWGLQHLDLNGENDVTWAEQKNKKIRSSVPMTEDSCLLELSATPMSLRETLQNIVKGKDCRVGMECPKEVFATRFRIRGDEDPRLRARDEV